MRQPAERSRAGRTVRVLVIVQNLPVPLDRRVWLECQALLAAGYVVSVICPQGTHGHDLRHEVIDGVEIHRYPPPAEASGLLGYVWEFVYCWIRAAALAVRVWRSPGFDVLQACNPPDTYFLLAALLKPFGTRFVFDHHDLCPEVYESRFARPRPALLRGLRLLERLTMRTADHVISTNESYRRIALTRGRKRSTDVTVVRSGPDTRRLFPLEPRPELKRGATHLCAYLGVMGPQDGVHHVVGAAEVIVHELGRRDCHFALLGFGDCLDDLQERVRVLGLDEWVTFTGRADDDTIRAYLSTAAVGLSPDPPSPLNDASTMNKTLEYMAFGLPVVAFDLHETRVSAGAAAAYVGEVDDREFAKEIVAVLDDPERRAHMGGVGRSRIDAGLSWQHQAEAYVQVYDRLFAGRSSREHAAAVLLQKETT